MRTEGPREETTSEPCRKIISGYPTGPGIYEKSIVFAKTTKVFEAKISIIHTPLSRTLSHNISENYQHNT
jgi:hypothetical protein